MIEDLLQEIIALEKEQEAKVRQSQQDSKDIVAEAKMKAAEISDLADDKIKQMCQNNVQKANADAKSECDKIIAKAEMQAAKLDELANSNGDKIIADIIRRLEVRYA